MKSESDPDSGCFEPLQGHYRVRYLKGLAFEYGTLLSTRNRSMHSTRLHTNIANFIYRCVKQNTERGWNDLTGLSCDAARCMPFRTLRVLIATLHAAICIATLERAQR
ncbi:hypothetical protein ALP93_02877 [Pseudomonas syringae pv. helianthi]|nr:hypothetical protein ALP93_02877 [Pseudomonas syringae pv. helianthi]